MTTSASIHPFDPKAPSKSVNHLWAASLTKEPKVGTTRVFFSDNITALSSLGPDFTKKSADAKRESVRRSVGSAVKELNRVADEVTEVVVDASVDPHAAGAAIEVFFFSRAKNIHLAAVAAHLAAYSFTLKTDPPSRFNPNLKEPIPEKIALKALNASSEWDQGVVYAKAQNLARTVRVLPVSSYVCAEHLQHQLMELPGNMMTPTIFCERMETEFAGTDNVQIFVRDEGMTSSLLHTRR
jgi:aminopeptidase